MNKPWTKFHDMYMVLPTEIQIKLRWIVLYDVLCLSYYDFSCSDLYSRLLAMKEISRWNILSGIKITIVPAGSFGWIIVLYVVAMNCDRDELLYMMNYSPMNCPSGIIAAMN